MARRVAGCARPAGPRGWVANAPNLIERRALCSYGLAQIADDAGVAAQVSIPIGDVDRGPIACAYDRAGR
jgi:hypothetical protein